MPQSPNRRSRVMSDRAPALAEAAPLDVVGTRDQGVAKRPDFGAVHGAVRVHDDEDVALGGIEAGPAARHPCHVGLLDDPDVGAKHLGDALGVVIGAAVDDDDFVDPSRDRIEHVGEIPALRSRWG